MEKHPPIPDALFNFAVTAAREALGRGDTRFSTRKAIEQYRATTKVATNGNLQRPLADALVDYDPRLDAIIERRDTPRRKIAADPLLEALQAAVSNGATIEGVVLVSARGTRWAMTRTQVIEARTKAKRVAK
jgi:hypothetical protein